MLLVSFITEGEHIAAISKIQHQACPLSVLEDTHSFTEISGHSF